MVQERCQLGVVQEGGQGWYRKGVNDAMRWHRKAGGDEVTSEDQPRPISHCLMVTLL